MVEGLQLLYALQALDAKGRLTNPLGMNMAEIPLEPTLAKVLLSSGVFQKNFASVYGFLAHQISNLH